MGRLGASEQSVFQSSLQGGRVETYKGGGPNFQGVEGHAFSVSGPERENLEEDEFKFDFPLI